MRIKTKILLSKLNPRLLFFIGLALLLFPVFAFNSALREEFLPYEGIEVAHSQVIGPDLTISNFSLSNTNPAQGEVVTATINIINEGTGDIGGRTAWFVDMYSDEAISVPCGLPNGETSTSFGNLDSGFSTGNFTLTFTAPSVDGTYTARVFYDSNCVVVELDETNNQPTITYIVGTSGPSVPTLIGPPHDIWINTNPTFTAKVNSPGVDVWAYFNWVGGDPSPPSDTTGSIVSGGGLGNSTHTWTIPDLADGIFDWRARADDSVGGSSEFTSFWTVKKDTLDPIVDTCRVSSDGLDITITWSSSEQTPSSGGTPSGLKEGDLQESINGGPWVTISTNTGRTLFWSGTTLGDTHAYRYRVEDNAGNFSDILYLDCEFPVTLNEPPWIKTTGGDVGSLQRIDAGDSLGFSTEYLAIANNVIFFTFDSARDWIISNYNTSGNINTGFDSLDAFGELWEEFGNITADDHASNGVIPDTTGIYAYPSIDAANSGVPITDFTWDGTGGSSVDNPVVLFINGNLNLNDDLIMGTKKVVFIVKQDIIVDPSVQNIEGIFVSEGKFITGTSVVPPPVPGTSVGLHNNVIIGSGGFPIMSYRDSTNGDLKFARCLDENCESRNIVTIAGPNNVGHTNDIILGSDGLARIIYYDHTADEIGLVRCLDESCEDRNITNLGPAVPCCGAQGQVQVALGTDGFLRILYIHPSPDRLVLDRCLNNDCTSRNSTRIDSTNVTFSGANHRLMLGLNQSTGFAYVGYSGPGPTDSGYLTRCLDVDCSNQREVIYDPGIFSGTGHGLSGSMAIGADNLPRIVHQARGGVPPTGTILSRCLNADCTNINNTFIDSTDNSGFDNAITIGPNPGDYPLITYLDFASNTYKYIRCLDENCENRNQATIASGGALGVYSTSISLGLDGLPRISHYISGVGDLGFIRCTNLDCSASPTSLSSSTIPRSTSFTPITNLPTSIASSTVSSNSTSTTVFSLSSTLPGIIRNTVDGQAQDGNCPECQLTVDGAIISFHIDGVDLDRDLGNTNATQPAELFNYDPSYLYIFATNKSSLGRSLLGKRGRVFQELNP